MRRLPLEEFCVAASRAYPKLSFTLCSGQNSGKYLIGTQKMLRSCPPAGMVSIARIIVNNAGEYTFQVLLRTTETGNISSVDDFLSVCEKISKSGNYKFCPGMNVKVFNETYTSVLRYESKSVRVATEPFSRVDSPNCNMWHTLAKNASIFEKDMDDIMCQPCKKMRSHLDQRIRASLAVTPTKKASRLEPSSRCPLSALSSASVNKRRENLMSERARDKKTIRKYEHTEITLDDDQSDEMAEVVDVINSKSPDALSEIFQEAEDQGKSGVKEIIMQK